MLVQNPSKIIKADFEKWQIQDGFAFRVISQRVEKTRLSKVLEIVLDENQSYSLNLKRNTTALVVTLFGIISIDAFTNNTSQQVWTIHASENQTYKIENKLTGEKANLLIVEIEENHLDSSVWVETISISNSNSILAVSNYFSTPNFIGLFDDREEQFYCTKTSQTVFSIVLNGVFEFQNRLLETRDALLLWEAKRLEFESLHKDSLIFFCEI